MRFMSSRVECLDRRLVGRHTCPHGAVADRAHVHTGRRGRTLNRGEHSIEREALDSRYGVHLAGILIFSHNKGANGRDNIRATGPAS